jgi:hypothetical protein
MKNKQEIETPGNRKAPRKHDPRWKDTTSTARTQGRTAQDNAWAQAVSGGKYQTLRTLMTTIHRGEIILVETQPTLREPDTRHAPDSGQSLAASCGKEFQND